MNKKKIFTLILILILSSLPVLSIEKIPEPQWSEFCPKEFLNAEKIDLDSMKLAHKPKYSMPVKILATWALLPVGIYMFCTDKGKIPNEKEILEYNNAVEYWHTRKLSFDANVATCKAGSYSQQSLCYMKVRELELQKQQIELAKEANMINLYNAIYK